MHHLLTNLDCNIAKMSDTKAACYSIAGSATALGGAGLSQADLMSTMNYLPEITMFMQFATAGISFLVALVSGGLLIWKKLQERRDKK